MVLASLDLAKSYRQKSALDGVTTEFGVGMTAVVGPNGAGKTTLLRCLASTLVPDRGEVRLDGESIAAPGVATRHRSDLGYVPQELGTVPNLSLRQFVEFVVSARRVDWSRGRRREEVDRAIADVGLLDRSTVSMRKLSGGMKQRALLAQALATDPRVLILDEPTVGLDPQQRALFRSLLVNLSADRIVLLSTHLMEDVQSLQARALVIDHGRAVFSGSLLDLAEVARGRVRVDQTIPMAGRYWHHAGTYRVVGAPGADDVEPLPEDGYLELVGHDASGEGTAAGGWGSS